MRIVRATALVVGIVALSYGPTASADLANGGFEAGLADWDSPVGMVEAVEWELRKDVPNGFWEPRGGSSRFASLWSTGWGGDTATLRRTFTAPAGNVLSFDYFFDFGDDLYHPDTAVATLIKPGGAEEILFQHNTPGHELTYDYEDVDWMPISVVLTAAGEYTLKFEVQDVWYPDFEDGPAFESILGVDMVNVVPLPGAVLLGALGLGSAGGLLRRLRHGSRA